MHAVHCALTLCRYWWLHLKPLWQWWNLPRWHQSLQLHLWIWLDWNPLQTRCVYIYHSKYQLFVPFINYDNKSHNEWRFTQFYKGLRCLKKWVIPQMTGVMWCLRWSHIIMLVTTINYCVHNTVDTAVLLHDNIDSNGQLGKWSVNFSFWIIKSILPS